METKICIICQKEFVKPIYTSRKEWERRRFCSKQCHHESRRITKKCFFCKKEFTRPKGYSPKVKFCSRLCSNRSRPDRGGSVKLFCEHCGKEYKITKATYLSRGGKYCSIKCRTLDGGIVKRGQDHWNWKGGIAGTMTSLRRNEQYQNWRQSVYKRDYYTCQICNKKCGKDIVAHHLKSFCNFPEYRYDVSNGITLCRSCHKKEHKEIGLETRFS